MHLAQLNVAQHRFAMDAPEMADFVAALDNINALAERSAGFIWRLKDDGGDATGLRMAGRDNLLVNLSVWRDLGSLRTFVYETAHAAVMARRAKWFEGFGGGHVALWWIAEGLTPDLDEAARRELEEETGLRNVFLEQLYTFGSVHRDPRERVVSIAYFALVKPEAVAAATDAAEAKWFPVSDLPTLAFDHAEILTIALSRLRGKLTYQPIGFELLPRKFTLTQLQRLYEAVLGHHLDKRNFRKKVLSFDLLTPLEESRQEGPHRPAQLFRFDPERSDRLKERGFLFE
jgi:8-oxo-dGTP diphosphatase